MDCGIAASPDIDAWPVSTIFLKKAALVSSDQESPPEPPLTEPERFDRCLGCRIEREHRKRHTNGFAADCDDLSLCVPQIRYRGADQPRDPQNVDVDMVADDLVVALVKGKGMEDRRVSHNDIEASEMVDDLRDSGTDRIRCRDIARQDQYRIAMLFRQREQFGRRAGKTGDTHSRFHHGRNKMPSHAFGRPR